MTTWVEYQDEKSDTVETLRKRIRDQELQQREYDEWVAEQQGYLDMQEAEYSEWFERYRIAHLPMTITRYGVIVNE